MLHDLISSNGFYFQFHLLERPVAALLYSTLHSQLSPLRFLGLLSDFLTKGSTLIYWQIYNFWLSFEYSMFHFYNLLQMVYILPTTNIFISCQHQIFILSCQRRTIIFCYAFQKIPPIFFMPNNKMCRGKIFSRQEVFSTAGFFHLLLT